MALPILGIGCYVSHMVAPYLADHTSDTTYPVDTMAMPTLRVVDHDIAEGTAPVLEKLSRAVTATMGTPALQSQLRAQGMEPVAIGGAAELVIRRDDKQISLRVPFD